MVTGGVLDVVPGEPQERLLTLTTCNPYPFTNGERMIVYSTFDTFYPRSGGLPDDLRQLLGESTGGD